MIICGIRGRGYGSTLILGTPFLTTMLVIAYSSLKIIGLYQKMKLLYIKITLKHQKASLRSFEKKIQLHKKLSYST